MVVFKVYSLEFESYFLDQLYHIIFVIEIRIDDSEYLQLREDVDKLEAEFEVTQEYYSKR